MRSTSGGSPSISAKTHRPRLARLMLPLLLLRSIPEVLGIHVMRPMNVMSPQAQPFHQRQQLMTSSLKVLTLALDSAPPLSKKRTRLSYFLCLLLVVLLAAPHRRRHHPGSHLPLAQMGRPPVCLQGCHRTCEIHVRSLIPKTPNLAIFVRTKSQNFCPHGGLGRIFAQFLSAQYIRHINR